MPITTEDDFDIITDYNKTPEELLTELFNLKNGTDYSPEQFTFGEPELSTVENRNTNIRMYGRQNTGMRGSALLHYNRVSAIDLLEKSDNILLYSDEVFFTDFIPQINEKFGILLRKEDVVEHELTPLDPLNPEDSREIPLTFKMNHKIFFGSIILKMIHVGVDLSEDYPESELDGFVFP
ncbi:MAG: hypothetical protein M0R77_01140 [Gammaproteobacteria bacterium]|nr:hypothetical protein [Acholeplasmataceae bacterium]MCK9529161.1 hypothetical protein [Gammaproteobacteria bacterium]